MKPGTDKILARATRAVERAQEHLAAGAAERAGERAYHAIVHAARALLNEAGDRSRTHAVIAAAAENLEPAAPAALREGLKEIQRWRDSAEEPLIDDVQRLVAMAREAVDAARSRVQSPH